MLGRGLSIEYSRARADAHQPWSMAVGDEHGRIFQPAQFAAGLRVQMHRGGVAPRAQDRVAMEGLRTVAGTLRHDRATAHGGGSVDLGDSRIGKGAETRAADA